MTRTIDGIEVTIGADPEFFLMDKDGKPISAHDQVPGDKLNPHKTRHGMVQADGLAVEFNIKPCNSAEQFARAIKNTMSDVRKLVDEKYKFSFTPYVQFDKDYFAKLPDESKELGCDPDFDAFRYGIKNRRPVCSSKNTYVNQVMRTGSGHLHIGWTKGKDPFNAAHNWDCCVLVQALDNFFQNSEWLWTDRDEEYYRRTMYGKPGSYRPKPYGVEYRALSNKWLEYPQVWPFLFNGCQEVFRKLYTTGNVHSCMFPGAPSTGYTYDSKNYPIYKYFTRAERIEQSRKKYKDNPNLYLWVEPPLVEG